MLHELVPNQAFLSFQTTSGRTSGALLGLQLGCKVQYNACKLFLDPESSPWDNYTKGWRKENMNQIVWDSSCEKKISFETTEIAFERLHLDFIYPSDDHFAYVPVNEKFIRQPFLLRMFVHIRI